MKNPHPRLFTRLALGLLLAAGLSARAATLTVSNRSNSGAGSLRDAINNSAIGGTIDFASGLTGTITLTSELLITNTLFINGPGAGVISISGGQSCRVINITNGLVFISDLTIKDGRTWGNAGTSTMPGGDAYGGGILNNGILILTSCVIFNCGARGGGGGSTPIGSIATAGGFGNGGAIANLGGLVLGSCVFTNNFAQGGPGGELPPQQPPTSSFCTEGKDGGTAAGGAIWSPNSLYAVNCTFRNNTASGAKGGDVHGGNFGCNGGMGGSTFGGAIAGTGIITLIGSSLDNNSATAGAGGGTDGNLSAGNGGTGNGGAVYGGDLLRLTNCTFTLNQAHGGSGGSGHNWGVGGGGYPGNGGDAIGGAVLNSNAISVVACTFYSNSVVGGDGGWPWDACQSSVRSYGGNASGGNIYQGFQQSSAVMLNTIVASGYAQGGSAGGGGCGGGGTPFPPGTVAGADIYNSFSSLGFNLLGSYDTGGIWISSDIQNTSPALGVLADNGGSTLTMRLLSGSPAVDAGSDSIASVVATDQRGVPRKIGEHVDIGAYESGGYLVMNTNDNGAGSLRQALASAPDGDTLYFNPSLTGTIGLTSGELLISANRNIIGSTNKITISGNNLFRVFEINPGVTSIVANVTISGGRVVSANGGGTGSSGSSGYGGGVLNYGTLTLSNCTLFNNTVLGGNGADGSFSVAGGNGGGGNGGAVANFGRLTVWACTVATNSAIGGNGGSGLTKGNGGAGSGGAVFNYASGNAGLDVVSCTFSGNSVTGGDGGSTGAGPGIGGNANGGGLYRNSGAGITYIINSIVAKGSAFGGSGGVNGFASGPDVYGSIFSSGNNLIGQTSGSTGWVASDLNGINPLLGNLRNNGGPTSTMALLTGSPAIDAGINATLATDQRNFPRTVDFPAIANGASSDGTDIGAYEVQPSILDIGLRVFDGVLIKKIAGEYPAISPLRISKNGTNYGIGLTAPNAADASKFRVQTSSGIKAWQTIP